MALQRPAIPERPSHGGDTAADPTRRRRGLRLRTSTEAVVYAKEHADEAPKSGAIYGGVIGGMTSEADSFIKAVMADMMDGQQTIPA